MQLSERVATPCEKDEIESANENYRPAYHRSLVSVTAIRADFRELEEGREEGQGLRRFAPSIIRIQTTVNIVASGLGVHHLEGKNVLISSRSGGIIHLLARLYLPVLFSSTDKTGKVYEVDKI